MYYVYVYLGIETSCFIPCLTGYIWIDKTSHLATIEAHTHVTEMNKSRTKTRGMPRQDRGMRACADVSISRERFM